MVKITVNKFSKEKLEKGGYNKDEVTDEIAFFLEENLKAGKYEYKELNRILNYDNRLTVFLSFTKSKNLKIIAAEITGGEI